SRWKRSCASPSAKAAARSAPAWSPRSSPEPDNQPKRNGPRRLSGGRFLFSFAPGAGRSGLAGIGLAGGRIGRRHAAVAGALGAPGLAGRSRRLALAAGPALAFVLDFPVVGARVDGHGG